MDQYQFQVRSSIEKMEFHLWRVETSTPHIGVSDGESRVYFFVGLVLILWFNFVVIM